MTDKPLPTVGDLFCGAGGFSEGFRQAGFELLWAIDNSKTALDTYRNNFPQVDAIEADLTRFDFKKLEPVDVLLCLTQRLGQPRLGQPEHPHHLLAVRGSAGDRALYRLGFHGERPHRLQLARRTGQHHDRRVAGHDDAGGGAHRIDHMGADRDQRLLAVGGAYRIDVDVVEARHQALE